MAKAKAKSKTAAKAKKVMSVAANLGDVIIDSVDVDSDPDNVVVDCHKLGVRPVVHVQLLRPIDESDNFEPDWIIFDVQEDDDGFLEVPYTVLETTETSTAVRSSFARGNKATTGLYSAQTKRVVR